MHALCHVFVSAATAGRAAADVLHGLDDVPLPAESRQALIDFYSDVAPELEKELRRGLDVPRYRALEWRLQVRMAGRYAPRRRRSRACSCGCTRPAARTAPRRSICCRRI